jgi:hypothetical protein
MVVLWKDFLYGTSHQNLTCVRLGELTTILVISMEIKPHEKSLGRNSLSDAPYRNSGMVLNRQRPSHHPLSGALYLDLDTVLNEQGSNRRILSDTLHRRPGVVKNEQGSSHLRVFRNLTTSKISGHWHGLRNATSEPEKTKCESTVSTKEQNLTKKCISQGFETALQSCFQKCAYPN